METKEFDTSAEIIEEIDAEVETGSDSEPVKTEDLIVVEQIPIIVQRLQEIKAQIQLDVEAAMSLEATEENKKQLKEMRSNLNKDFEILEAKRKEVKTAILAPYYDFEDVYKDCVTGIYKPAIQSIKSKIDSIEIIQKQEKEKEISDYFIEACKSKDIDFVTLEDTGVVINLSVSIPKCKKTINEFLNRVSSEIILIESQQYKDEILVEYKKSFSVSDAINTVNLRHKAIEEAEAQRKEKERREEEERARQARFDAAMAEPVDPMAPFFDDSELDTFAPTQQAIPDEEQISMPEVAPSKPSRYSVTLKIEEATLDDLKAIKNLFEERGMKYEQLG